MQDFPGGSRNRVNKAGSAISQGTATFDDLQVVEAWRLAHRYVLNTFQAILRIRTRGKSIVVAQRHKRRSTIFDKLSRIPGMQLSRMDDVAGIRLIFPDLKSLFDFRNNFLKARFGHRRRNEIGKYDYIASPKKTGYRGIHDVYEYDVNSEAGKKLKGLYVEIQYRTQVQHTWATAVELIGQVTHDQPKFQRGSADIQHELSLASEILSRTYEELPGPFPEKQNRQLVEEFLELDLRTGMLDLLKALSVNESERTHKKNLILQYSKGKDLKIQAFDDAPVALRKLFQMELEFPEDDIVLVRADTDASIRVAYKNYFTDGSDFVDKVEDGCRRLVSRRDIKRSLLGTSVIEDSTME